MAPKRRVQVVSRRLRSSPGYYPDIATIPKRAHQHGTITGQSELRYKYSGGGIESVSTWEYFELARDNGTSTVIFDTSSFHPEKVRDWGHTEMNTEDIYDKANALIGKWGK